MIKLIFKTLFLLIIMYYLFLFEISFLPFFTSFSFLMLFVILINIFEEPSGRIGLFSSFLFGLLWDIYSSHYIGLMATGFLLLSFLLKLILSRYVKMGSLSWLPKI